MLVSCVFVVIAPLAFPRLRRSYAFCIPATSAIPRVWPSFPIGVPAPLAFFHHRRSCEEKMKSGRHNQFTPQPTNYSCAWMKKTIPNDVGFEEQRV